MGMSYTSRERGRRSPHVGPASPTYCNNTFLVGRANGPRTFRPRTTVQNVNISAVLHPQHRALHLCFLGSLMPGRFSMVANPYIMTMRNGIVIEVLFGEATAEQLLECYILAGRAWGSYLDEDEIIRREQHLRTQALAREGGCRTWCLYRRDDHTQVLSTCSVIRRDLLLNDTEDVNEAKGYCINSVVTALLYRGHGLASYLLQNVAQWLDGPGEAAISLLYSGIPDFYENLGWTALSNTEVILGIRPWLRDSQEPYADLEVRSLNDADIDELCTRDTEMVKAEAKRVKDTNGEDKLTILPTADLVRYQHASAEYMCDLWHCEAPKNRGAVYNEQAWLSWYHDVRGRCLYIQRIHNTIQEEGRKNYVTAALLLRAVGEAKEWNFTSVATWDTSPNVRSALDVLARASVFTKTVGERRRTQRISIRRRNGEKTTLSTVMDNEAYAWNPRT